jgi:hypothetical protein
VSNSSLVAGRVFTAVLGAATALVAARVARTIWPDVRHVDVVAAMLVGFWPSLVLWSAFALKDSFGLLCVLGVMWGISWWLRAGAPLALVIALVSYTAYIPVRPYAAILLGNLVALVAVVLRPGWTSRLIAAAFALCVGLVSMHFGYELFGFSYIRQLSVGKLASLREGLAEGDLKLRPLPHDPTVVWVLLDSALRFVLGPFPWAIRSRSEAVALIENVVWWPAVAAGTVALWRSRGRWRQLAAPLGFVFGLVVLYTFVEGNFGTGFRHRAQIVPVVLCGTAVLIASRVNEGAEPLLQRPQAEESGRPVATAGDVVVEEATGRDRVDDAASHETPEGVGDD